MAYNTGLAATVGGYVQASQYNDLVTNADWLRSLLDAEHDFHVTTGDGAHKDITALSIELAGRGRSTAHGSDPGSGTGLEWGYNTTSGYGFLLAYDRDLAALKPLYIQNGAGIWAADGTLSLANATDATSKTAGAVMLAGGLAVAKRVIADALAAQGGALHFDAASGNNFLSLSGGVLTSYVNGLAGWAQDNAGRVGIGQGAWSSLGTVDGDLEVAEVGGAPRLRLAYRSEDGTPQVADADVLGIIDFWGWDNNLTSGANNIAAQIKAVANGSWTSDAQGTADLSFLCSGAEVLRLLSDGGILMPTLPTSDPAVAGKLWNDSDTLKISAG